GAVQQPRSSTCDVCAEGSPPPRNRLRSRDVAGLSHAGRGRPGRRRRGSGTRRLRPMRPPSSRRRLPIASVALAAALVAPACGKTDDRPAVWPYISAELFQPNCATASCHSSGRAVAGLDFSDPGRGYTSLTGLHVWIPDPNGTIGGDCVTVDGTVYCERDRVLVVAFDPSQSRLVNMLRARSAPRMPPDRPLP